MLSNLPYSPRDVLSFSSLEIKENIMGIANQALYSREWLYPDKKAATSLEEMTIKDMAYWVYKCTNPISNFERGISIDNIQTLNIISLPVGFIKTHSITFGALGDLLQADGLDHSHNILYEDVKELLFDQSISFANFESPVTKQPLKKEVIGDAEAPIECCNYYQFKTLTSHQNKHFTVLNIANNHIADMGIEGISTTLEAIESSGTIPIGLTKNKNEHEQGKIIEVQGIKIGFVSSTFGLNGKALPETATYKVHVSKLLSPSSMPDTSSIEKQIDFCKEKGCDFIILSLHWGFEFEFYPRKIQIEVAHRLVEYGVDAIICHHPHVIQPVEYYRTQRDPKRIATIAYSLGSATWGFTAPHLVLSLIQNLKLTKGYCCGKVITYIERADVTPIVRDVVTSNKKTVTRLVKLSNYITEHQNTEKKYYADNIRYLSDLILKEDKRNDAVKTAA